MPVLSRTLLALPLLLTACAVVGPDYQHPPQVQPPAQWQAEQPAGESAVALRDWWQSFGDETLSQLIQATLAHHPNLESSQGAIAAARAALLQQQGGGEPQATVSGKLNRSGNSPNLTVPTITSRSVAVDASWEMDLFGRVKRATEGAEAKLAARQADRHALQRSLAAEVAGLYNELRGCEQVVASMEAEVASRQNTAAILQKSVKAGFVAAGEGALSQAGLADARSQLTSQRATCQGAVKGLVALSGLEEGDLRQRLAGGTARLPRAAAFAMPSLPIQLLHQRPDLVAAEQELIAANAAIGEAEANRYPRLALLGTIGVGVNRQGQQSLDQQPWSFGPTLSLPLLDGEVRQAAVEGAKARHTIALANYRQAVIQAVKEVETSLVNLVGSQQRREDALAAARSYGIYFRASEENWRQGGISLLTLEEARRLTINAERAVMQLERQQVQYWINLFKAVGGGWQQAEGDGA